MHQTFYIDADEEISSVIDRLKKSMATDNYFVAPKRAIFLQSIVNLKLLKREADKMKKHVVLVSQEEIVIAMATRSGIDVQDSIDGSGEVLDVELKNDPQELKIIKELADSPKQSNNKSARLNSVGSSNFYEGQASMDVHHYIPAPKKNAAKSTPVISSTVVARPSRTLVDQGSSLESSSAKRRTSKSKVPVVIPERSTDNMVRYVDKNNFRKFDSEKEKTLEKMFSQQKENTPSSNPEIPNVKTKKMLFIFVLVCLFLFAGVAGYLYIPNADIIINPNVQTVKIDTDVNVGQAQQGGNSIEVHAINSEQQITLQYNATGKSFSSGKKAQGTVTIYNEFSNQPQTLVATTRIQSDGGKVFRLLKTITVPGSSTVGGEMKPGAISAEVVADQPGADYNIEASNFKIPGFQGGPKYDKFYAKSSAAISGGTTEGNASAGVSQNDLDSAKQKTEAALKEKIAAAITGQLQVNEIALPQAEKITPGKSSANAKVGDGVGSFEYTATANVIALIFSEQDVKNIIENNAQFKNQPQDAKKNIKDIEYVSVEPSFENATILLKVHSEIEVTPNIDVQSFKKDLLGKNESELTELLKKNQNIGNVSVIFWPTFVNRVPQFPERVKIEVEKGK